MCTKETNYLFSTNDLEVHKGICLLMNKLIKQLANNKLEFSKNDINFLDDLGWIELNYELGNKCEKCNSIDTVLVNTYDRDNKEETILCRDCYLESSYLIGHCKTKLLIPANIELGINEVIPNKEHIKRILN